MTGTLDDTPPLLANRYQVIRILGEGGFGTTFLATDTQLPSQRKCVVKQLKPSKGNPQIHQLVMERFQREAAILESLGDGSDQIPSLYANFAEGDVFYLVEEWIEGDTLIQKLEKESVLSESAVHKILVSLLQILDYIHQNKMVHRDIKPDNIILRWRDGKPVLLDFGAVKETMVTAIDVQGLSSPSIVVGTPGFMPTEQVAGRPVYSSDLYSLGMTAVYLLTGRLPQDLETDLDTGKCLWQQWVSGLSTPFADALDKAIQLHSRDRFSTAQEMLVALQGVDPSTTPSTGAGVSLQPTQPVATAVSMPPEHAPTLVRISSGQSVTTQMTLPPTPLTSSSNEWKKAVIMGGLIGASILGAAAMVAQQLPHVFQASKETTTRSKPKIKKTVQKKSAPKAPDSIPIVAAPEPQPEPQSVQASSSPTNATVMGHSGSKYIRTGVGTQYSVVDKTYPGDRVQVLKGAYNRNGFLWYQVYAPNTGSRGWMASHLVDLDGQAPTVAPSIPAQAPPRQSKKTAQSDVNAIIIGKSGSKNIRSGPGTNYSVKQIAYPGDRVRIVGSGSDRGGYPWYKVYFPRSGTEGWIGAQLVEAGQD